jgi:hypothetical protein
MSVDFQWTTQHYIPVDSALQSARSSAESKETATYFKEHGRRALDHVFNVIHY